MTVRDPLRRIPGIGPSISDDLRALGIHRVEDLEDQDPQVLYARLCVHQGRPIDRCVLYVFRCAVYYAITSPHDHDPELLKWWNWKDRTELDGRRRADRR